MLKPILISGIQPSGNLHLGNYLGAIKNFKNLQDSGNYRCFFFVADLHSINKDFQPKEKSKQVENIVLDYLASGIDPKKSTLFIQSEVSAHSELAVILSNFTPLGELKRMTQFKEKSESQPHNINSGLLYYPILMAADILLYNAKYVPVGDDQDQHLEFARTLARKFNARFGKTFIEPKGVHAPIPRLMSLDDPNKKMSKSRPAGCLFLDDSQGEIKEKMKKAVTDSGREIKYDPNKKPAVSNLLMIYSEMTGKRIPEIERNYKNKGYADFKKDLAEVVVDYLRPIQEKRSGFKKEKNLVGKTTKDGTQKAIKIANEKITEVKKKIGLKVV